MLKWLLVAPRVLGRQTGDGVRHLDTASYHQYSVQALTLLSEVTATLLDIVYRSEEKERVVPLLNTILYHIFPYLKNHR